MTYQYILYKLKTLYKLTLLYKILFLLLDYTKTDAHTLFFVHLVVQHMTILLVIHCGVVGNIQAFHVCAPGSIPGDGVFFVYN